jgi:hypothetical protein
MLQAHPTHNTTLIRKVSWRILETFKQSNAFLEIVQNSSEKGYFHLVDGRQENSHRNNEYQALKLFCICCEGI